MTRTGSANDFSQGSIPKAIMRMSLPMIAAQIVNALYNIVDRAYIGRIPGSGALALTGVGLVFPVIMIITAFTNLCGQGAAPLCSIARGEKNNDYAERIIGTTLTAVLSIGLILMAVTMALRQPLLRAFGASDNTIGYASDYLTVYLWGTPFVMAAMGLNPLINSQGFSGTGMLTILIGAVANTILDPVFIFLLGMGIRGAALATVLSQGICAVWAVLFFFSRRAILRIRPRYLRVDWKILGRIMSLGVSNFTMALTESSVQIVYNTMLLAYGGDLYIAAMTIIASVRQVFLYTLSGLSNGMQPVMGYNYGAGRADRIRKCVRFTMVISASYLAVTYAVIHLFPQVLIRIFNSDPELLEIAARSMHIYFAAFVFVLMQNIGQNSFVALGFAKQATFFSLLRKAFIVIPVALILPRVTNLGPTGVFLAEPISDLIGPAACFFTFYFTVYRRLDELVARRKMLEPTAAETQTKQEDQPC